jgi:NADPH:quinone reductase-like Zn-dependent oxidoreductase
MARQGAIESLPKAPFILGFECSGVIEQVGEGVEKFKVSKISAACENEKLINYILLLPQ